MWAGELVQMEKDRLPKKAEAIKQMGRRKGGHIPQYGWEYCIERNARDAEEDEKWREKSTD